MHAAYTEGWLAAMVEHLVWGMSMVSYHWGSRSSETACVKSPGQLTGGGELSGTGSTIGNEK